MRDKKYLFEKKRIAILEALIQAETQLVFQLEAKGMGYLWKRVGEQSHH